MVIYSACLNTNREVKMISSKQFFLVMETIFQVDNGTLTILICVGKGYYYQYGIFKGSLVAPVVDANGVQTWQDAFIAIRFCLQFPDP